ncbi:hypothetical protein M422DRAFT_177396, partial [Sphaerobolus stellatus SS14]
RPCISQIQAATAQLEKGSDVVYISGTGSGKILTFWMRMLYDKKSITILVTAPHILGKQTADILNKAGIPAANLTEENANAKTFRVRALKKNEVCFKSLSTIVGDQIVVSPEL